MKAALLDLLRSTQHPPRSTLPWLFTHHWLAFGDLLRDPVPTGDLSAPAGRLDRGRAGSRPEPVHDARRHQLS